MKGCLVVIVDLEKNYHLNLDYKYWLITVNEEDPEIPQYNIRL